MTRNGLTTGPLQPGSSQRYNRYITLYHNHLHLHFRTLTINRLWESSLEASKLRLVAKGKDTRKEYYLQFHIQVYLEEDQLHHLHLPCQERRCHIGQIHRATKVSGGVCAFENHTVFLHVVGKKKNVQKSFHRYCTDWWKRKLGFRHLKKQTVGQKNQKPSLHLIVYKALIILDSS